MPHFFEHLDIYKFTTAKKIKQRKRSNIASLQCYTYIYMHLKVENKFTK